MWFYLTIFITFSILLLFSAYNRSRYNIFIFIFFFLVFVIPGLRGDIGQDTYSYSVHYEILSNLDGLKFMLSLKEPFLYIIMYLQKLIYNSYTTFLLLVAFLQATLLYSLTKNLYHKSFFLLFYILIFFINLHFNTIRVGLAAHLYLYALSIVKHNKKKSLFLFLLSVLTHLSILVLLPIILTRMKLSIKNLIYFILFTIFLYLVVNLFFGQILLSKSEAYSLFSFDKLDTPLVALGLVIIAWVSTFLSKNVTVEIKSCLLLFSLFFLASGYTDIAYRLYSLTLLVLLFLITESRNMTITALKFKPLIIGISVTLLWISYGNISYLINEGNIIRDTGHGKLDFTYIPYHLYIDSENR